MIYEYIMSSLLLVLLNDNNQYLKYSFIPILINYFLILIKNIIKYNMVSYYYAI